MRVYGRKSCLLIRKDFSEMTLTQELKEEMGQYPEEAARLGENCVTRACGGGQERPVGNRSQHMSRASGSLGSVLTSREHSPT